jgi:Family of unknown function (DUF6188)
MLMIADEVIADANGWTFPLSGVRVTGLRVSSHVLIELGDDVEIVIESPFRLYGNGQIVNIDMYELNDAAMVRSVLHRVIQMAIATRLGSLEITFENMHKLEVPVSQERESWRIHLTNDRLYWGLKGGGVGMFDHSVGVSIRNIGGTI